MPSETDPSDVVFIVDLSQTPTVTVKITSPGAPDDLYTVHWGEGMLSTTNVAPNTPVSVTYTVPGTYVLNLQDQTTGRLGLPMTIAIPRVADSLDVECPADQKNTPGETVAVRIAAVSANPAVTYTWSAYGLPPGLRLVNIGGGVAWFRGVMPAIAEPMQVVAFGDNGFGNRITCRFTWSLGRASNTVAAVQPPNQTTALGEAVSLVMAATDTDPDVTTYTWSAEGLPAGLSLDPDTGKITGKPTSGRSAADVTITATDPTGAAGSTTFGWTVTTGVTVATVPDQSWTVGEAIEAFTVTATDTDRTITDLAWSISPDLPAGVTLDPDTGEISGKPEAAAAKRKYTLTAVDYLGAAGSKSFNITVSAG